MTMNYYLGLDIGTTGIKAGIFDAKGNMQSVGLQEYTLETPKPDIVELAPEVYWQAAQSAIKQAIESANLAPEKIKALAITGQVETLIMLDNSGKPVRKAIVWLDNRAHDEAEFLEKKFGTDALFRLSGQTEMLPCWPAAKILWYQKNEPENFARTAKYLMVEDYIVYKLSGKFVTSCGLLPSTLYFDIRTNKYDDAMLSTLNITHDHLPELKNCTEVMAVAGANDSLIAPGTIIAAAPLDHICGNLGSGCAESGFISETTGCTLALCANFPQIVYDEARQLSTYLSFEPGSFVLLPWAPTAGMLLKHFRDEFANMDYKEFDAAAAKIAPGSEGLILLPHCAGAISPDCNPHARGTAWGITLAHKREHWARAIMESVAYLLRSNVEALQKMGCQVKELRSLGGGAKSKLWLQIKSDVLNLPITVTECADATALGAAMLAAVAAKEYKSCAEAAENMVKLAFTIQPSADAELYEKYFKKYTQINQLVMPTYKGDL